MAIHAASRPVSHLMHTSAGQRRLCWLCARLFSLGSGREPDEGRGPGVSEDIRGDDVYLGRW